MTDAVYGIVIVGKLCDYRDKHFKCHICQKNAKSQQKNVVCKCNNMYCTSCINDMLKKDGIVNCIACKQLYSKEEICEGENLYSGIEKVYQELLVAVLKDFKGSQEVVNAMVNAELVSSDQVKESNESCVIAKRPVAPVRKAGRKNKNSRIIEGKRGSRSNCVPFEEVVSTEVPSTDQHTVIESNEASAEDHNTVILRTSRDYTSAAGMLIDKKTSSEKPVKQVSQASSSSAEKNTHAEVHVDVHKTLIGSFVKSKHTKKPPNFSVHKNRGTVLDDRGDINSIVSETVMSPDNKMSRKCRRKRISEVCAGGITEVLSVSDRVEKAYSSTQTEINMDSSELDMEVDEMQNKIPKWDSSSDVVKRKKIVKTCNRMQEVIDCYGTKNDTQTDYKDLDRKDREFKYGNNSFNESHDEEQKEHSLKSLNLNKMAGVKNDYTQDETVMDYEVNNSEDATSGCENKCTAKASRSQSTASSPQNILTATHSCNLGFQKTWEMYATNYYRYSNTDSRNTNNNNNYVKTINGEPVMEKKITNNNISCDSTELAVDEDDIVESTPENLISQKNAKSQQKNVVCKCNNMYCTSCINDMLKKGGIVNCIACKRLYSKEEICEGENLSSGVRKVFQKLLMAVSKDLKGSQEVVNAMVNAELVSSDQVKESNESCVIAKRPVEPVRKAGSKNKNSRIVEGKRESRSSCVPFGEAVSTEVPSTDQHTVIESNEASAEDFRTGIFCTSGDYTSAAGMLVDKKTSSEVRQASQASSSSGSEKNKNFEVHVDVHKTLNGSFVKSKHTKKPPNFIVHKNRATVLDDLGGINSIVSETVVSPDNKVSRKCRRKKISKVCAGGITEVLSVSDYVENAYSSTQTEINMDCSELDVEVDEMENKIPKWNSSDEVKQEKRVQTYNRMQEVIDCYGMKIDYEVNNSEDGTSDYENKCAAKAGRSQSTTSSPQNILTPAHSFNLSFQKTWEMYTTNYYRYSIINSRNTNNNNNYVKTINREPAIEKKITNNNISCNSVELAVDEDDIVEVTPENLIRDCVKNVHQNRVEQVAEKSKEFNLAISLLDRQEEYDSIFEFIKHFGGVFEGKSSSVTVDTTHLIMKPYENNRIRPTLKYFKAILLHKPVVSFDWILKSLRFGKPVPEEYFLVYGENGETAVQVSLTDEHSSLFEKTSIIVLGPSNSGLSASSIEDLLIAGAAYVYKEKDFKKVPRTLFKIVLTDMRITQNMCRDVGNPSSKRKK